MADPMNDDRDYRVFKRAAWLMASLPAKSVWPVILAFLPVIYEIIKAWLESRANASDDPGLAMREIAAGTSARARRAWEQAEYDVRAGRA